MLVVNGISVKGSVYRDTSKKEDREGAVRRHNVWRASVSYDGKRYRMRSNDRHDCELFLLQMQEKHSGTGTDSRS